MATEIDPFAGVKTMIEQFKVPGMDMGALVDARRKDIESLVEANKATYQAMQALARKQTEMLSQAIQSMQEVAKSAVGHVGDPAKQAEVVRKAFEKTLDDVKELAEIASRAQSDALARVTKRGTEHIEEIKKLMAPKKA